MDAFSGNGVTVKRFAVALLLMTWPPACSDSPTTQPDSSADVSIDRATQGDVRADGPTQADASKDAPTDSPLMDEGLSGDISRPDTAPAPCGPANCRYGCCKGNVCRPGRIRTECGTGGEACQECAEHTHTCEKGRCKRICNHINCFAGCCDDDGTCHFPSNQEHCGIGGGTCAICKQDETCKQPQMKCEPKTLCGPATCPNGCCKGNVCHPGSIRTECGTGGGACQECNVHTHTCEQGHCKQLCNAINCFGGCCDDDDICHFSQDQEHCGSGAVKCAICKPDETCKQPQMKCEPK